jgi:hypothetical protein
MNATRLLTATTFLLAFGHSAVAQTAATTSSQFGVTATDPAGAVSRRTVS